MLCRLASLPGRRVGAGDVGQHLAIVLGHRLEAGQLPELEQPAAVGVLAGGLHAVLKAPLRRLVEGARPHRQHRGREDRRLLEDLELAKPAGLFRKRTRVHGAYLVGSVGRGKTMLMDLFFSAVPIAAKRRVHFDEFMDEVHTAIAEFRRSNGGDPIPAVTKPIIAEARLLCLDEFQVADITNAMLLGRLFDTVGRRTMITVTYGVSGVLLALSGYLFSIGMLTAQTQTIAWMVIFFFASPAASAAYLTVSETFPLEVRALAIALFYAIGTGIGGVAGPALFGALIDTGSRYSVFAGYLFGSALMNVAAAVAWRYAIAAERKSLESQLRLHVAEHERQAAGLNRAVEAAERVTAPDEGPGRAAGDGDVVGAEAVVLVPGAVAAVGLILGADVSFHHHVAGEGVGPRGRIGGSAANCGVTWVVSFAWSAIE